VTGDRLPADFAVSFLDDFAALSGIGATGNGGVERQAATAEDAAMRAWLTSWMEERGFRTMLDPIGNLFGVLELRPGAPTVLVGSHLDSQPLGGRYDGAYGVLAAAHAVHRVAQSLRSADGTPRFNLGVVDWFNEEGSRFKPSMMGSAVFTGLMTVDDALATIDAAGISVAQALRAIDAAGTEAIVEVAAYVELHIEQGPGLEDAGVTIGAVDSTWCAYKYEVVVRGAQSHTGSTPMGARHDALLAAAHLVVALNELTKEFADGQVHTSVGELLVLPNSPVVVAREVRLLMDLRSSSSTTLDRAFEKLQQRIAEIEDRTAVSIDIVSSSIWRSGPFPLGGVQLIERTAREHGLSSMRVPTLAGHDATNMKERVPTLLFFVPSIDGISHSELEFTTDDDLLAGFAVLVDVLATLAVDGFPDSCEAA
jgi:N-carbamoyl-L-amino-acid hydrolase